MTLGRTPRSRRLGAVIGPNPYGIPPNDMLVNGKWIPAGTPNYTHYYDGNVWYQWDATDSTWYPEYTLEVVPTFNGHAATSGQVANLTPAPITIYNPNVYISPAPISPAYSPPISPSPMPAVPSPAPTLPLPAYTPPPYTPPPAPAIPSPAPIPPPYTPPPPPVPSPAPVPPPEQVLVQAPLPVPSPAPAPPPAYSPPITIAPPPAIPAAYSPSIAPAPPPIQSPDAGRTDVGNFTVNYIIDPATGQMITEPQYQALYPNTQLSTWDYDPASGLWTDHTPDSVLFAPEQVLIQAPLPAPSPAPAPPPAYSPPIVIAPPPIIPPAYSPPVAPAPPPPPPTNGIPPIPPRIYSLTRNPDGATVIYAGTPGNEIAYTSLFDIPVGAWLIGADGTIFYAQGGGNFFDETTQSIYTASDLMLPAVYGWIPPPVTVPPLLPTPSPVESLTQLSPPVVASATPALTVSPADSPTQSPAAPPQPGTAKMSIAASPAFSSPISSPASPGFSPIPTASPMTTPMTSPAAASPAASPFLAPTPGTTPAITAPPTVATTPPTPTGATPTTATTTATTAATPTTATTAATTAATPAGGRSGGGGGGGNSGGGGKSGGGGQSAPQLKQPPTGITAARARAIAAAAVLAARNRQISAARANRSSQEGRTRRNRTPVNTRLPLNSAASPGLNLFAGSPALTPVQIAIRRAARSSTPSGSAAAGSVPARRSSNGGLLQFPIGPSASLAPSPSASPGPGTTTFSKGSIAALLLIGIAAFAVMGEHKT